MNVKEFEAARPTLACARCGQVGALFIKENINNRGQQVFCPNGCSTPIPGQPFLSKHAPQSRKQRAWSGESMSATWFAYGNRCSCCGTHMETLERLGIGLNRNHVPPFFSEDDEQCTTLLPICAWCHEIYTATQRAVRRIIQVAADTSDNK